MLLQLVDVPKEIVFGFGSGLKYLRITISYGLLPDSNK